MSIRGFKSREEVDAYFSGDRIVCLICDRAFVTLPPHLLKCHNMTSRDYKLAFGIPMGRGLAGTEFKRASSKRMQTLKMAGKLPMKPSDETIAKINGARWPKPVVAMNRQENIAKLLRTHGKEKPWTRPDFDEFLNRVRSGRPMLDVANDPDMPSTNSLYKWMRKDPSLRSEFDRIWESLPYPEQVRIRRTGANFKEHVIALRNDGMQWSQMSRLMGIKASTLRNVLYNAKKKKRTPDSSL